jgi:Protein of unknown function (DUF1571)
MARILVCLPLCLLLAPSYPGAPPVPPIRRLPTSGVVEKVGGDAKLDGLPNPQKDVLGFFKACLNHYDQNVRGYTLNFWKKENIDGKEQPLEILDVWYRDHPLSVYFNWQQGARLAAKALYVEGENTNAEGRSQIMALPTIKFLGVQKRDPDSADAKKSGRYTMNKFGLKQAMERVVEVWSAAEAAKTLHVDYLGLYKVMDAGGKICHTFHRHKFARPEEHDGVTEAYIFVDQETLLQVGSVIFGEEGKLLGEYYFRSIQLNPEFAPGQFTPAVFKK